MKQINPLEKALRLVIIGVFVLTTILSLASCGKSYSPLDTYIDGQNQRYADSTRHAQEVNSFFHQLNHK
jgi:hypothetical protein